MKSYGIDFNSRNKKYKDKILILIITILIFISIPFFIYFNKTSKKSRKIIKIQEAQLDKKNDKKIEELLKKYKNLGVVNIKSGTLNIRSGQGINYEIIAKASKGAVFDILEKSEDSKWLYISSGGIKGYVSSENILTGNEAISKLSNSYKRILVPKVDELRVRQQKDDSSEVVDYISTGQEFEVLEENDEYIKINNGYVKNKDDLIELKDVLIEAKEYNKKLEAVENYNNFAICHNVTTYVNVRKEKNKDDDRNIVAKLPKNAIVEVLKNEGEWTKIKFNKKSAYVYSQYLEFGQKAKELAIKNAELMVIIKTDVINVRTEPSTEAKIWTQLKNTEKYPFVRQVGDWVEIELEDEEHTYVNSKYVDIKYSLPEAIAFNPLHLKEQENNSKRAKIVKYAMQFLGNPYVWGGTSLTRGCDCSGFTMQVLGRYGYSLPHFSVAQSKLGKKVTKDTMKPGDLIFYANSRGRINHVSIYIGNGQVVHAASRRSGIKISAWNYRRPVAIRNIVGD